MTFSNYLLNKSKFQGGINTIRFKPGFFKNAAFIIIKTLTVRSKCFNIFLFSYLVLVFLLIPDAVSGVGSGAESRVGHLKSTWQFYFAGTDSSRAFAHSDTLPEFDTVTLPHTFPRQDSAGPPPAGIGWYLTDIPISPTFSGKDLFIEFGGVCLRADVFADGRIAGESPFPYMPFRIDLTPFIQGQRKIRLAVRVDNRLRDRELPDKKANGFLPVY